MTDKQEKSSRDTKYITMKEWKLIKQKEEENEEGRGNFEKVEKQNQTQTLFFGGKTCSLRVMGRPNESENVSALSPTNVLKHIQVKL